MMKGLALSAVLAAAAIASPLQFTDDVCKPNIVYEYVYVDDDSGTPYQMPSSNAAPKPVVLAPAVPHYISPYSLQHLTPKSGQPTSLYFQSPQSGISNDVGYSAIAKVDFNAPSVVIDHSGYAKVQYSAGKLVVHFTYTAAYKAAKENWEKHAQLYLMSFTPGCGNYEKGEYCFFSSTHFAWDESTHTVTCSGEAKDVTDCVDGYQVDFGHGYKGGAYGSGSSPIGSGNSTNPATGTNGTSIANITAICTAPVDKKYGLPTACLGPYFDGDLDDIIGYENGSDSSWAPKLPAFMDEIDDDDLIDDDSTDLSERAAVIDWVNKKVINPAINKVKDTIKNKIIPAIQNLGTFNLGPRTFPFKVPRSQNVDKDAPWPNAKLMYRGVPNELSKKKNIGTVKGKEIERGSAVESALNLYCVDCGVQGSVKVAGSVKVGKEIIDYIVLETEMDMTVSMYAGITGNISVTLPSFSSDIVSTPITPLSIPPFIDVGPSLTVGVDLNIKVGIENAKVLAGGTLTWKGTKARMAYKNGGSSGSGWTPEFKPLFNASGELSLALDFGLPVELLLGVKLASSKKLGAGFTVEARPGIEAKASMEGSIVAGAGIPTKTTIGDEQCPFIKTGIDLKFESGLNFKIGEQAKFPLYKFHEPWTKTIHRGCISKTDNGLSFKTLPINSRQVSNGSSSNDTLWYLDTSELTDMTSIANASDPSEAFEMPEIATSAYNDTDGAQFVSLYDSSRDFLLASCGDGNMYMQLNENLTSLDSKGCGTLFAYDNNTDSIYGDGSGRVLYYYPDEMNAVGVSRLRASAVDNVPKGAQYIYLVPTAPEDDDSEGVLITTDPIYVATDSSGGVYGTAVCTFSNSSMPPKIFLVAALDAGIAMLKNEDIKYSVTGGDVSDCFYLPLSRGDDTPDDAWNGVANNLDWVETWVDDWVFDDKVLDDNEFELTDAQEESIVDSLDVDATSS